MKFLEKENKMLKEKLKLNSEISNLKENYEKSAEYIQHKEYVNT